jgi:hypothetical protein
MKMPMKKMPMKMPAGPKPKTSNPPGHSMKRMGDCSKSPAKSKK